VRGPAELGEQQQCSVHGEKGKERRKGKIRLRWVPPRCVARRRPRECGASYTHVRAMDGHEAGGCHARDPPGVYNHFPIFEGSVATIPLFPPSLPHML
jgi:hypothetical protein